MNHKYQATCYGLGLGIDYILFFYEDRNFCGKKPYLWKITPEMRDTVLSKIKRVNAAVEAGEAPERDESKCTYCNYKGACKIAEMGAPEPSEEGTKEALF